MEKKQNIIIQESISCSDRENEVNQIANQYNNYSLSASKVKIKLASNLNKVRSDTMLPGGNLFVFKGKKKKV